MNFKISPKIQSQRAREKSNQNNLRMILVYVNSQIKVINQEKRGGRTWHYVLLNNLRCIIFCKWSIIIWPKDVVCGNETCSGLL